VSIVEVLSSSNLFISNNGRKELPIVPQNVDDQLSQYALELLRLRPEDQPVDAVLHEMEDLAARESIPIIGPLEGAIIQMLVRLHKPVPQFVLDIGTAIGYSAIWLARSLPPQCKIISIDIDPVRAELAREFIDRAGFSDQIEVFIGDIFEILPEMDIQFDIILQDIIKHVYFGKDSRLSLKLLDLCIDYLVDGGILLGDNVFCMGEVLHDEKTSLPKQVIGIQAYNQRVATHPQLDSITIPIRDGLWVSQKRSSL
jgi:predicted O-methyltransferase YrrM